MFQDLRYGLRLMTRRPGFAAVAVATLALGIGTTTAIFAVTDRVLLRPVPYAAPERLAVIWETSPTIPLPVMYASPPNLYEWQQRSKAFSSMGGLQWRDVTMGGAEPQRIRAARVTAGLLPTLGVQPQIGRWFLPEEDRAGGRPVMVISDALWRRRFRQTRSIIGVSASPGNGNESVVVNTWSNTGDFYIRVAGRSGAFSTGSQFALNVTKGATTCNSVGPLILSPRQGVTGSGRQTIILTDSTRVAGDPAALIAKLEALAGSVAGAVVGLAWRVRRRRASHA